MARGASRAVSAEGLAPSPDDRQTAEALAQVVEAAGEADVVVMGDARDAAGVAGGARRVPRAPTRGGGPGLRRQP